MLTFIISRYDFLQGMLDNVESLDSDAATEVALNWVLLGLLVSILAAGLVMVIKGVWKLTAGDIIRKSWSRGQTWILVLTGLVPILVTLLMIWKVVRNFYDFAGIGGLVKGVLVAWVFYLIFAVFGHLVSPWRREIL